MLATLLVAAWALLMAILACALVVVPDDRSDHPRDERRRD